MQTGKQLLIIVLLVSVLIKCQVSPQWLQSNRVDTGNKILVSNHQATTTTFTWNTSYNTNKTFSQNPTVILSIRQLRIASNNSRISFLSRITGMPTMALFYHFAQMTAPTQIWFLEVRYFAYDGGYFSTAEIQQQFIDYDNTNPDFNSIDSGAGTPRFDVLDTTIPAVAANRNILASFTTGFTGTITSTYFEGNVTQLVDTGNFKINVTVHSDTQITKLAFYFLRIDLTQLYVKAQVFAEYALTNAYRGVQYTFYTPSKVLYQTNYISGLRSFSLMNNVQYNFTIYLRTFTTFNDSRYNDVTHVNLWVRYCPTPYIFLNKVDLMCYQLCPAGTYPILTYTICQPCDPQCATCSTSGSCLTCNNNRILSAGGTCVCQDYFYEYNGVCIQCHYSCQQCTYSGQYFNCMQCDPLMYRNPPTPGATNTTCACDTGFVDVGVTMCDEVCGDGVITVDACDDKNLNNNDGCNSKCQIEMYFQCDPPVGATPSICYFIGDITIDVVRIQKDPNSNNATFYLKVQPYVQAFNRLQQQNFWTNISTAQFMSFQVKNGLLVFNISYYSDFDGQTVMMGLKPSASSATNIFARFFPKNDTFVAKADNGLYLNAYLKRDYTESAFYSKASLALGWIFLIFGCIFCFGDWKEIGLEMFFSLQICFMTYVVIPYHNPYITNSLNVKHVMGWNQISGEVLPPYHKVAVLEHMGYSVDFQRNFNIMALFPALTLVMYAVYRGLLYRHTRRRLDGDTSKQFEQTGAGKFFQYFKFDLFVYWMLVSMQQILISTVVQTTYISNGAIFVFIILCLAGIIVSIVALFWRPKSMLAYRQKLFHKSYGGKTFLIVLVSVLIMDLLILLSTLVSAYIFYGMVVCPLFVAIYVIARRPFKLLWNNFRLLIIECCIITVVALQLGTLNIPYLDHKLLNIGILTCMAIILIVTLVSWIYDIVKKICKLRNQDKYEQSSKYQSKKQEQSINEKVREAGYALVHGNGNASRLPTVYQMSNMPTKSQLKRSIIAQPLKSPRQQPIKRSARQPQTSRDRDSKLKQPSELKSKARQREPEPDTSELRKPKQQNASKLRNSDYEELKKRQDTEERTERPSARRPKTNPYTQILNQTAYRYK